MNRKTSSNAMASKAARALNSNGSSKIQKSLAASVLSQRSTSKQTGVAMEDIASRVLQSNKYSNETLVFRCDAGTFRGRVNGDHMTFTKDGVGGTYTIYKPTTQDVLEGKGNFNRGNSTELVIEAQLCAAFNRGVATDPANYQNPSAYYKNGTYNYYSRFLHEHSVNNFSYGFCYDDVNDQSTLLHYTNPTALILDLKW